MPFSPSFLIARQGPARHRQTELQQQGSRLSGINTMYSMLLVGLWLVAWPLAASEPASETAAPTTVILVRHAEKAAPEGDPPLSAPGRKRAHTLVHVLADAGVQAIYATPYRRTQETAQPLAEALGIETRIAGVERYGPDLAAKIRREHGGEVVVAVSHSNTVPELIAALGVEPAPTIPDHAYDDLFIVTLVPDRPPTLLVLAYGEPSSVP